MHDFHVLLPNSGGLFINTLIFDGVCMSPDCLAQHCSEECVVLEIPMMEYICRIMDYQHWIIVHNHARASYNDVHDIHYCKQDAVVNWHYGFVSPAYTCFWYSYSRGNKAHIRRI